MPRSSAHTATSPSPLLHRVLSRGLLIVGSLCLLGAVAAPKLVCKPGDTTCRGFAQNYCLELGICARCDSGNIEWVCKVNLLIDDCTVASAQDCGLVEVCPCIDGNCTNAWALPAEPQQCAFTVADCMPHG